MSNILYPGQNLYPNQQITSDDGSHRFIVQTDGNCVIYKKDNNHTWATGTDNKMLGYLAMQGDGNLVLYDRSGNSIWDSKTYGHNFAYLKMQNDGNLVVYPKENQPNNADDKNAGALWSTGTYGQ
jgi:hypothetical protein